MWHASGSCKPLHVVETCNLLSFKLTSKDRSEASQHDDIPSSRQKMETPTEYKDSDKTYRSPLESYFQDLIQNHKRKELILQFDNHKAPAAKMPLSYSLEASSVSMPTSSSSSSTPRRNCSLEDDESSYYSDSSTNSLRSSSSSTWERMPILEKETSSSIYDDCNSGTTSSKNNFTRRTSTCSCTSDECSTTSRCSSNYSSSYNAQKPVQCNLSYSRWDSTYTTILGASTPDMCLQLPARSVD